MSYLDLTTASSSLNVYEAGMTTELNRLPGDFFGERGVLIGAEEPGTIRALTFVVAYEVSAAPFGRNHA